MCIRDRNRKTLRVKDWIKEDKAITEKLKDSSIKEVKESQNLGKRGEMLKDQTPKPEKDARPKYEMANTLTIRGCCKELNKLPHIQTKKKSTKQSSVRSCDGMMTLENKKIVNTTSIPNKNKSINRKEHLGKVLKGSQYMETFLYGGRILRGGSLDHIEQTIDDPGRWKRFYPDVEDRIPPNKGKPNELEMLKKYIG